MLQTQSPDHRETLLRNFDSDTAPGSDTGDTYDIHFGRKIQRIGKAFSYTFWRTVIRKEVFWSIQGNSPDHSAWIITVYFGPPEEAKRYQQEIILHHPTEKKIKMFYSGSCLEGMNCIKISRTIVEHFRNDHNDFQFEFRILKLRKRPYSNPDL